MLCQDFNEQFEGYTQQVCRFVHLGLCCFVRISMNNLKDIHNITLHLKKLALLLCQDFNEQFEGYTQLNVAQGQAPQSCFVRISMNNLKDIHNCSVEVKPSRFGCFVRISMNNLKDIHNRYLRGLQCISVALSGFQ